MKEKKASKPAPRSTRKKPRVVSREAPARAELLLSQVLDRLQGLLAVLNADRRVVFANQAFLDFVNIDGSRDIRGMRPGEIFTCPHATGPGKSCGEEEDCRLCGAHQAIQETLSLDVPATREFKISRSDHGKIVANEFRVRTMPFTLTGESFILISLRDISGEKRKTALERIFFHDILNTAASIKVYLDLLRPGVTEEGSRKLLERLDSIAETLLEEIRSQKILLSAENKTLTVQKNLISARELAEQVIRQFEEQDIARGKKIAVAAFSENISLVSDDSLLRRVLVNCVKNALEASEEGASVIIGFGKRDGRAAFWVHNPGWIEDEIRNRIFQRYFSTKGEDRGLGTYSMKLLTEEYLGGEVKFESDPKTGTTFTVTLPLRP